MIGWHLAGLLGFTAVMAFFFAKVEIHIEGEHGWAGSLPTWRIEEHWLLDIFWGSRPMTGYHAWVFSFVALVFHLPLLFSWAFSLKLEARAIACAVVFWLIEDFLWFVLNPHFGIGKFNRRDAPWHKRWLLGVPVDYLVFAVAGAALMWYSFT